MRIRPLVSYASCALASFALSMGAAAHAFTYSVRYQGEANPNPAIGLSTCDDGFCPFVSGSAFPTDSVQQVVIDYVNPTGGATVVLQVELCTQSPGGSSWSCSNPVNGVTTAGAQQFTISSSLDGGTAILDTWTGNIGNYSTLKVIEGDAAFYGYQINGN